MKHRVAITGMGVVSPIGLTVGAFAENLRAGVSGIRRISIFDASTLPSQIAAEVPCLVPYPATASRRSQLRPHAKQWLKRANAARNQKVPAH